MPALEGPRGRPFQPMSALAVGHSVVTLSYIPLGASPVPGPPAMKLDYPSVMAGYVAGYGLLSSLKRRNVTLSSWIQSVGF